mgnify:CR=1 FL=1
MNLQNVRGMRDLIGLDARIQEYLEDTFRKVFNKYGYQPLYTPAVENFDLFKVKGSAGDAIKEEIYYFKDKSGRELGLRFELTASLARVVATNQLKMPFRRYQIGEVYRYDRPQAKRYRAFTQADADILGIKGLNAELEIFLALKAFFDEIKLKPILKINSRKLLQAILEKYTNGKEMEAMRIIDKMDAFPKKEIKKMLQEKGINSDVIELIERNSLEEIKKLVGEENEGLKEVNELLRMTKELGLNYTEFDSKLARGLEYYTGIVFEIKLDDGPSVLGGGRYDNLIGLYGGQETPAVGFGMGISRIIDYLKENNFRPRTKGLYLFGVGINDKKLFEIAEQFRKNGIAVEMDIGSKNLSKNIEYAQKKGYTFVGIIGENELNTNKITIKNIGSGEQEQIGLNEISEIKKRIE